MNNNGLYFKNEKMKKILFILILFTTIGCWTNNLKPIFKYQELSSSKGTKIYLKSKNWGLTFDHQLSVISNNSSQKWEVDSLKDYVFPGLQPFLYEFKNDTLFLYPSVLCKKPKDFQSSIPVIQNIPKDFGDLIFKVNNDSTLKLKIF